MLESRELLTVITVTTTDDVVSAVDGFTSLREAVAFANGNAGADLITFGPTANGTIQLDPAQGELTITDPVTITGNGNANTTIDGQNNTRVFKLIGGATDVTFDSLTITGGRTTGNDSPFGGAGIRSEVTGTLTILNSSLTGNSTMGSGSYTHSPSGGAIYMQNTSTLVITNSSVTNNSTAGNFAFGGAIYGFQVNSTLTITDSTVTGNSTTGANAKGGAISWYSGSVTISGGQVSNNFTVGSAASGGAIYSNKATVIVTSGAAVNSNQTRGDSAPGGGIHSTNGNVTVTNSSLGINSTLGASSPGGGISSPSQQVTVTGSTVQGNSTAGNTSPGGGISTGTGNVTVVNSTISGNSTTGDSANSNASGSAGGGIFSESGVVAITSSTISGNSTSGLNGWGGGIRAAYGSLTLVNSTVSGNSSTSTSAAGGGLSVNIAPMSLTNCTVAFNSSAGTNFFGGGIFAFQGNVTLNNTIVAKNTNAGAPDLSPGTGTLTVNNSLIGIKKGTNLTAAATPDANGNLIGIAGTPIDPVLGPLQNNGGMVQTHALLNSPAIDRGSNTLAANVGLTDFDAARQPRISGQSIDMGAFEFQTPSATFSATFASVSETAGTYQVTVNLSAASAQAVTVPFSVGGTANNPADYTIAASPLIIPAGQTSGTIQITIVNTAGFESDETVILTMGNLINATPGNNTTTTVTITDSSTPPTVTFSTAMQSVSEGVGVVVVTVNLSAPIGQNVTVPFSVNGSAANPADYTIAASPLIIPPGQTSGTFNITVVNDPDIENNETIGLTLGTPTNATPGAITVQTVTIVDNDAVPAASFSVANQSVSESAGTVSLTVNLSLAPQSNVTIPFSVTGGSAANGTDFSLSTSPLVILAGTTSGTISLNVVDDALIESDETVIVTLGTPTNATLGAIPAQTVTITNNDINHAPTFNAGQQFSLAENSPAATVVGTVVASDSDLPAPNNSLSYSFSSNPGSLFVINPATGQIMVANGAVLDFDTSPTITLGVTVTDGAPTPLSTTQNVTVNLTNVNEPPVVTPATFSIAENSGLNTEVGIVVASDPDAGQTKTFSIPNGNAGGAFAINSSTGAITVATPSALNFEANQTYTLTVQVTDSGSPGLSGTATITVNVTDVNELPVVNPATFSIAENPNANATIGTITATDPDNGQTKSFSITAGNTGNAFAINSSTGAITVATPSAVNFETTPTFSLTVRVTDNGSPAAFGTANVTINLSNVNEAPVVNAATFSIAEGSPVNTGLGTVTATDPDAGQVKTYSITAGNTGGVFTIGPTTGTITVAVSALDFETTPTYHLTVQVTDTGNPALSGTATITINLTNVNDPPVLVENSAATAFVVKAKTLVKPFPAISVNDSDGNTTLASVTVTVQIPAGKKNLDIVSFNPAGLGIVSDTIVGSQRQIKMTLTNGVTTTQVETFLKSFTFFSKGASLKTLTRQFTASVTDKSGAVSNIITRSVAIRKK